MLGKKFTVLLKKYGGLLKFMSIIDLNYYVMFNIVVLTQNYVQNKENTFIIDNLKCITEVGWNS